MIAYPSVRFPADPYLPREKAEMPNVINYGWSFRDKMFNTFMLPAKYDFADWEILVILLIIKIDKSHQWNSSRVIKY